MEMDYPIEVLTDSLDMWHGRIIQVQVNKEIPEASKNKFIETYNRKISELESAIAKLKTS